MQTLRDRITQLMLAYPDGLTSPQIQKMIPDKGRGSVTGTVSALVSDQVLVRTGDVVFHRAHAKRPPMLMPDITPVNVKTVGRSINIYQMIQYQDIVRVKLNQVNGPINVPLISSCIRISIGDAPAQWEFSESYTGVSSIELMYRDGSIERIDVDVMRVVTIGAE